MAQVAVDPVLWTREDLRERSALYRRWAAAALEPAPDLPVSTWAQRNVHLPQTEPVPGPLSPDLTPYLPGLLDLASNPDVTEITFVCSTQVGKTLAAVGVVAAILVDGSRGGES
jgi:phage terminase large subunit GpA-like protein